MSLEKEIILNARIRASGIRKSVFDGLTTTEQRRERFRKLIRHYKLEDKFGAEFKSIYGVTLVLWAIFRLSFDATSGMQISLERVDTETYDRVEDCLTALGDRNPLKTQDGVAGIEICKQTGELST